ncbi:hypothetical protein DRJ19_02390 [Candidatus Woesearchaeota archaeon]|nr:MAG: hypothetical protein DRJ19_02390 [Candidatus Woesearchaeota archaeon]
MNRGLIILAVTILILVITPYVVLSFGYGNGVVGVDARVLWDAFMDYLQGGQPGIVVITIVPVDESGSTVNGNFIVRVHNFTDYYLKPHSDLVYQGREMRLSFKVSRIPLRRGIPSGEKEPRIIYKEHEYTIFIYDWENGLRGARLVRFEPAKPLTELTVKIPVQRFTPPMPADSLSFSTSGSPEEVKTTQKWMEAVQLHSIQGVSVRFYAYEGNNLYYSQKNRELNPDYTPITDWSSTGDKATPADDTAGSPAVSDGTKKWAIVYVTYRYERWPLEHGTGGWYYLEIVTPVMFSGRGLGNSISCSLCGGSPTGSKTAYQEGTTSIERSIGPGVEAVEKSGISISFTVSYGPVSLTVELYKEATTGSGSGSPKLQITVNTWIKEWLIAFDDNTGWKIVHFTWSDTPP